MLSLSLSLKNRNGICRRRHWWPLPELRRRWIKRSVLPGDNHVAGDSEDDNSGDRASSEDSPLKATEEGERGGGRRDR